ncbi:hypothetical protein HZS_7294 [Henneguya salminicola]|nr:hypothetical protein HZS_7294 [Henneguya salminicola]
MFDFSYESIKRSTDESLKRLGLDCVDILFAHDVEFAPDPNLIVKETIPALNDIKNMRKTKYIGIAGYSLSYLRDVIMSSIIELDFVITYSRYVIFDESLNEYLPFFKSRNIFVINGSPTAMGLLTESNPPRWHPAKDSLKNACKKASFEFKKNNLNISEISIKYALKNKGINILLIGPKNLNELKNCMEAGMSELSLNQEEIFFKIKKEYFDILEYSEKSWEELEVKEYRRKLKNQK